MSSAGTGLDALLQTVANTSLKNPVEPYVASAWNYMTDNFERFTIAVWFSVVFHEVRYLFISSSLKLSLSLLDFSWFTLDCAALVSSPSSSRS